MHIDEGIGWGYSLIMLLGWHLAGAALVFEGTSRIPAVIHTATIYSMRMDDAGRLYSDRTMIVLITVYIAEKVLAERIADVVSAVRYVSKQA